MVASDRLMVLLEDQGRSLAELRTLLERLAVGQAGLVEAVRELAAQAPVPVPATVPVPAAPASVSASQAAAAPVVVAVPVEEAPRPGIAALCERMEALHGLLVANAVGVDANEIRFLVLARQVLGSAGAQQGGRLIDLLRFTDQFGASYLGAAYAPLQAALTELRVLIAATLPDTVLIQATGAVATAAGPRLPVAAPIVLATGLSRGGQIIEEPQAVQPLADPPLLARTAWALVEELFVALRGSFRRPLRDDILRLVETIVTLGTRADPHLLRSVLNVHTGHCEQAGSPAAREALAVLRSEAGWIAQELKPGERFDPDRHDHRRFERVPKPQAGTATGTVLALRQVGLVDQGGLAIQRCIVITAS